MKEVGYGRLRDAFCNGHIAFTRTTESLVKGLQLGRSRTAELLRSIVELLERAEFQD
jgi:hypothetical protein